MSLPAEVQALLDAQPAGRFSVTAEGKVKCELNGHTLPAKADALQAFLKCAAAAAAAAAAATHAPPPHGHHVDRAEPRPTAARQCMRLGGISAWHV